MAKRIRSSYQHLVDVQQDVFLENAGTEWIDGINHELWLDRQNDVMYLVAIPEHDIDLLEEIYSL